jgi:hypothetical protein
VRDLNRNCGIPTLVAQRRFALLCESQSPFGSCFRPPEFQRVDAVRYDFRLFMAYRPALYARSHEIPQALYRLSPVPEAPAGFVLSVRREDMPQAMSAPSNVIPFRRRGPKRAELEVYRRITRNWSDAMRRLMFPHHWEGDKDRKGEK